MHGVAKLLLAPGRTPNKQRRIAFPGEAKATMELH
jgi:hypothetical protein